jgi:hypothetical protein
MTKTISLYTFLFILVSIFFIPHLNSQSIPFNFYALDSKTHELLDSAFIEVKDTIGHLLITLQTDSNGHTRTQLEEGKFYKIFGSKNTHQDREKYLRLSHSFVTTGAKSSDTLFLLKVERSPGGHGPRYLIFKSNSYAITDTSLLNELIKFMKENTKMEVEVSSHADCREMKKLKFDISKKRSEAVKRYIVKNGIDSGRIEISFYGDTRPMNACNCKTPDKVCEEEDYASNRRAEFKLLKY